jgi:hypothetical protein
MRRLSVRLALKFVTVVLKSVKSMRVIWSIASDAPRSVEIVLKNAEAWRALVCEVQARAAGWMSMTHPKDRFVHQWIFRRLVCVKKML